MYRIFRFRMPQGISMPDFRKVIVAIGKHRNFLSRKANYFIKKIAIQMSSGIRNQTLSKFS